MKQFYPTLQKSCRAFFDNLKSVFMLVIIDIMFFISFALVYAKVWEKATIHVNYILDIMGIEMAELAGVEAEAHIASLLSQQSEFLYHYRQIGFYVGMLLVSVLAFWCVFHGINWFITQGIVKKAKVDAKNFFGRFTLLSALWWFMFMMIMWLSLKLSMYASMEVVPLVSGAAAKLLVLALLFCLFCLAYSSYSLAADHNLKHIFKALVNLWRKKYNVLLPAYLFMAVVLVGEYFFFMRSFAFGGYAALVFALVILFPTLAWTRFYALVVLKEE